MVHYITISSSYSMGTRIAMHFTNIVDFDREVQDCFNLIFEKCGDDTPIATHSLTTDSDTWESVVKCDGFFEDLLVIDELEDFIQTILKDRVMSGVNVAQYILSLVKCTHLKLQKLVYLCYADYLCAYNKPLFDDTIRAFQYGPVVETVYQRYKKSDKKILTPDAEIVSHIEEMPSRSRIMFAKDGGSKIRSIDKTLKKYSEYSASALVDLTHETNSPWSVVYGGNGGNVISDDVILDFHRCV